MMNILLTQGKHTIVDDKDYEWLSQWKWTTHKVRHTFYAVRNIIQPDGKRKIVSMHRVIMGLEPGDKRQIDHKNHCGLANWRDNLRICTVSQNHQNRSLCKNCSSDYKGIYWHKRDRKWMARITINGQKAYLGCFISEVEAAKAYGKAARNLFGEFAYLGKNNRH